MNDVITIRQTQIKKAVLLSILAQTFQPAGKKFGVIVWGQSGCGKNHATDGIHTELKNMTNQPWGFLDLNVSGMMPEDMTGLPHIQDGNAVYAPLVKAGKERFGICRIDEIDRPTSMGVLIQAAKFCIDRTSTHPLPTEWFILGQGNGVSDSHTQELTEHIRGRFIHVYVSMNTSTAQKEYADYLESRDVHPAIAKFNRMSPLKTRDEFEAHAVDNARTREYANSIVKAYVASRSSGLDFSDVLFPVLAGTLGRVEASELVKCIEMDGLLSLEEVISAPDKATIPVDLGLRHRYLSVLVAEASDDCNKAKRLVDYVVRYPAEVARYALDLLVLKCPAIATYQTYTKWLARLA